MIIPDAAIEAAAEALFHANTWTTRSDAVDQAHAALSAAMPAIREALAQEVIRSGPVLNWELNFDGSTDNTRAAYVEAFRDASSIVRGGTP